MRVLSSSQYKYTTFFAQIQIPLTFRNTLAKVKMQQFAAAPLWRVLYYEEHMAGSIPRHEIGGAEGWVTAIFSRIREEKRLLCPSRQRATEHRPNHGGTKKCQALFSQTRLGFTNYEKTVSLTNALLWRVNVGTVFCHFDIAKVRNILRRAKYSQGNHVNPPFFSANLSS